jgi:hypothetical protein
MYGKKAPHGSSASGGPKKMGTLLFECACAVILAAAGWREFFRYAIVSDVSHIAPLQRPEQFNAELQDFQNNALEARADCHPPDFLSNWLMEIKTEARWQQCWRALCLPYAERTSRDRQVGPRRFSCAVAFRIGLHPRSFSTTVAPMPNQRTRVARR